MSVGSVGWGHCVVLLCVASLIGYRGAIGAYCKRGPSLVLLSVRSALLFRFGFFGCRPSAFLDVVMAVSFYCMTDRVRWLRGAEAVD